MAAVGRTAVALPPHACGAGVPSAVAATSCLDLDAAKAAGARRRTATPGAPAVRRGPAEPVSAEGLALWDYLEKRQMNRQVQATTQNKRLTARPALDRLRLLRLAFFVLGAVCIAAGTLMLLLREAASRADRIAVFRGFLETFKHLQTLPLPVDHQGPPPPHLRATWLPQALISKPREFKLDRMEVPLTQDVLSDSHDIDDELLLPVQSSRPSESDEPRRSIVYRTSVELADLVVRAEEGPLAAVSSSGDDGDIMQEHVGTLAVHLPDGRLLLQHQLALFRWLPGGSDGGGQKGIAARLCYAVRPDGGPWDGALVSDCEHGHRSPLYVPVGSVVVNETAKLEIVLRGRMDAYVHASEVTRGCSNCFGYPLGRGGKQGIQALSCGERSRATEGRGGWAQMAAYFEPDPIPGRCFGRPWRRKYAIGLSLLGIGCGLLALALAAAARPRAATETASLVFGLLAAMLLFAAFLASVGIFGALRRAILRLL